MHELGIELMTQQAELAKVAIEPLSTALGATLATILMLAFALAWRRLAARAEAQHIERTSKLEAQVTSISLELRDARALLALNVTRAEFVDHIGRSAGALHEKINQLALVVARGQRSDFDKET
jgi:hypothetical protein